MIDQLQQRGLDLNDVVAMVGAGLVLSGLAMIYVPAALIVAGVGLLALAFQGVLR